MDEARFAAGDSAYAQGDWKMAAREYLAAAHGAPAEGSGVAYHHAGNSLMKLKRFGDAATVYGHALNDPTYDKRGIVYANLGAALGAAGRHEDAVSAYEAAIGVDSYPTPYKALQGKAGCLFELGRYDEASKAYRDAAWSEGNPDPGKSLNNLGLCFMALGKPEEAVEAYKAALGLEDYSAKGKAAANLGLAYAQMGFHEEAVHEFEAARDTYDHPLAGPALAAYAESLAAATRPGRDSAHDVVPGPAAPETVEGWATGEMPPVFADGPQRWGEEDHAGEEPEAAIEDDSRFFTMSEDDMKTEDREARKTERQAARTPKALAIRVAVVLASVAVLVGAVWALLYFGFGYPTQEQTVGSMLDAYRSGRAYTDYWVAVPQTDVKQEMRLLPAKFASYRIEGVDRSMQKSTARVVVRLDTGSELIYDVLLVREGVGWKVNGVKNRWGSTGG